MMSMMMTMTTTRRQPPRLPEPLQLQHDDDNGGERESAQDELQR
jgi:hypothetical protein